MKGVNSTLSKILNLQNGRFKFKRNRKKALSQFKSDKSLFGKDGTFAPLLKNYMHKFSIHYQLYCVSIILRLAFPYILVAE